MEIDYKRGLVFFVSPIVLVMPVMAADYLTDAQAQKVIFSEADEFVALNIVLKSEQLKLIKERSGVRQRSSKPLIWKAFKRKKEIGYLVVDEVIGKHEYITYATGVSASGEVLSVEIMSYRETHGGEVKEASWRKHFQGKKISDPFKLDQDVPNITGATLSSRNILDGVKRVLVMLEVIKGA